MKNYSGPILSSKLKTKFVDLSTSSTCHGLPNILRSDHLIIKIIWFIFVACSTAMCAFMIYRSVFEYISYDVVTKVRVFSEMPAEFPTITICNLNPFAKNTTVDYMKDIYLQRINSSVTKEQITTKDLFYVYKEALINAKDHTFGDDKKKLMGPDFNEMLLYCSFNNYICSHENFSWIYTLLDGNCFQFNSGIDFFGKKEPIRKVYREGQYSGLLLELFINENERFMVNTSKIGIKVMIDNSSSVLSLFSKSIYVRPGTFIDIALHKVITERLPSPYSDCQHDYPDYPIYAEYKSKGLAYREKDCVFLCLQEEIIQECQCYDSWYDNFDNKVLPCVNDTQIECAGELFGKLYENGKSNKCSSLCKVECSFVSYEISSSSAEFPSVEYSKNYLKYHSVIEKGFENEGIPKENITHEFLKARTVSIIVYLNDLYYTKISEVEKMNMIDLVASIGGTLGLFLGMSILTFIEILEIIFELCIVVKKHKNRVSQFENN